MRGGTREALAIRRTPPQEGVAERMESSVPVWKIQNGTLPREIGVLPTPPIPPTPTLQLVPSDGRERKKRPKNTQKQHPSAALGPFWPADLAKRNLALQRGVFF